MDKKEVMQWLERRGTRRTLEGLSRYGIEAKHAFGVTGTVEHCSWKEREVRDIVLNLAWNAARRRSSTSALNSWR